MDVTAVTASIDGAIPLIQTVGAAVIGVTVAIMVISMVKRMIR